MNDIIIFLLKVLFIRGTFMCVCIHCVHMFRNLRWIAKKIICNYLRVYCMTLETGAKFNYEGFKIKFDVLDVNSCVKKTYLYIGEDGKHQTRISKVKSAVLS